MPWLYALRHMEKGRKEPALDDFMPTKPKRKQASSGQDILNRFLAIGAKVKPRDKT